MKLGIIGHGWLGNAVRESLEAQQIAVRICTRNALRDNFNKANGLDSYLIDSNGKKPLNKKFFDGLTHLMLAIPPTRDENARIIYQLMCLDLLEGIETETKILFISSTGVYPDLPQNMDETFHFDETWLSNHPILLTEEALTEKFKNRLTIFRFGGLVGKERQPANYLSGKILSFPKSAVNLIHLEDCVNAVNTWIQAPKIGIFNLVSPEFCSREAYYFKTCESLNLSPPILEESTDKLSSETGLKPNLQSKRILSDKFIRSFHFQFKYASASSFSSQQNIK